MAKKEHVREAFITNLLEHGSVRAACEATGIAYVTGRRWLAEPDMQQAYNEARHETVRLALAKLQAALTDAVDTLVRNLGPNQPAAIQVRAAQVLLESALKATDLIDLDARISALEAQRAQEPE